MRLVENERSVKWEKVLYNNEQSRVFNDNYVDKSTFLKSIKTEENMNNIDYMEIMMKSTEISISIVNVIFFLILFDILHNQEKEHLVFPIFMIFLVTVCLSA